MAICTGPTCTRSLPPHSGPGRPRKYCSIGCLRAADTARKSASKLPSVSELEDDLLEEQLLAIEGHQDAAAVAKQRDAAWRDRVDAGLDDLRALRNVEIARGGLSAKALVHWIKDGTFLDVGPAADGTAAKAALVEDAAGQYLIPADITLEVLQEARRRGTIRELASRRTSVRNKQRVGLLSVASVGWGRLETGTAATDPNTLPGNPGQEIEVFDLTALAKVGVDELDDATNAEAAVIDAISSAIADAEDAAFAAGTGSGQPKGLALAGNVARVPAGQKTAAAATATPTAADVLGLPWKLPTRYRDDAVWLFSEDAAPKIAALTYASGSGLMPAAGKGEGPLGWPYRVVPGLPSMATAGATDASVWFVNLGQCYRIVDRGRLTVQRLVQRYAEEGLVGLLVRWRVGGDMVRPAAAAIYTL